MSREIFLEDHNSSQKLPLSFKRDENRSFIDTGIQPKHIICMADVIKGLFRNDYQSIKVQIKISQKPKIFEAKGP